MFPQRWVRIATRATIALSLFAVACAPQAPPPAAKTDAKPAATTAAAPAKPAEAAKPAESKPAAAAPAKPAEAAKPAATAGGVKVATGSQLAGDDAIAKDRSGSGGTLTIAMSAANVPIPNTPPSDAFEGRRFVGYQIYDGILNFDLDQPDKAMSPKPGLAESWKVGDDKLTWTFNLRKNVKFHDGTPMNAEAIVFNLDRNLKQDFQFYDPDVSVTNRNNLIQVASYRAVDEHTLEVKTKEPWSILTWDFALIMIASPTAIAKDGNKDYPKNPVGTGPFKVARYVDGQVMELVPNENYWDGKPKLDKIVLRPMPDPSTRLAALQSGEVQWAEVPPPDSIPSLQASGFNILLKQYPHTIYFDANRFDPPLDNPKAREALQYALDREKMCTALLNNLCAPANQFPYEGHPWYVPEIGKKYTYDPAKAKQLMAEAGHPNGFSLSVAYPNGGSGNMWPQPMMEMMQANFKAVGIDLKLVPLEWNNILSMRRQTYASPEIRQYNLVWASNGTSVPSNVAAILSSRIPPAGCCNMGAYNNQEFDRLFNSAMQEFDPLKFDGLVRQALAIHTEESAYIYLVHDLNLRVLSPKVRGFVMGQSWFADFRNVWVQK